MRRLLPVAAVLMCACAGAKLKAQSAQIADLQANDDALTSSLSVRVAERDAAKAEGAGVQAKLAETQAKLADAEGKLAIASARVESLTKSNRDLSNAAGASQSELGAKLKAAIAEKDALAKTLADAQQKALSAVRLKGIYRSARNKAVGEFAAADKERVELRAKVERYAVQADSEAARAAIEAASLQAKLHDELGSVADVILPDIQAGRAFATVSGRALVVKFLDSFLFDGDGDTAKLTGAGTQALERVGRALKALGPRAIRVEAHNDASPLKRGLLGGYEDHWELSAAQAAAAARALNTRARLEPARMTAVADAQFHPFPSGEDGCGDNRCVVISAEQVLTE